MNAKRHNLVASDGVASVRTCIVSRAQCDRRDLIRFVLSPDGDIVPDLANALPGRGAWVVNSRRLLEKAIRTGAFKRAMRRRVNVEPELGQRVSDLLCRRALRALSLANKAGCVVTGFTGVEKRIDGGECSILIQAADASDDGKNRLARKYRAVCGVTKTGPVIVGQFSISQLSLAIGRPNVVHAALTFHNAALAFGRAADRFAQYEHSGADGSDQFFSQTNCNSPSESANDIGQETEQV
ncbi:MAG: RNA-binding protein [Hyphomicrobiaceae bacterium]